MIRKSLSILITYLVILFASIGVFYLTHGDSRTEFWSFPTLWSLWFYLLFWTPLIILPVHGIYKLLDGTLTTGLVVFILLLLAHTTYASFANSYKKSSYDVARAQENIIQDHIDKLSPSEVKVTHKVNKYTKRQNYTVTFEQRNDADFDISLDIDAYIEDSNDKIDVASFTIPANSAKPVTFALPEKKFRGIATSEDEIRLTISYRKNNRPRQHNNLLPIYQQICTWSIIGCDTYGTEAVRHNTEIFSSSMFPLKRKFESQIKPLHGFKLSEFTSLDSDLPFGDFVFISEDVITKGNIIKSFLINLSIHSKIDGDLYTYLLLAKHGGAINAPNLTEHIKVQKGVNAVSIAVDTDQLTKLVKNSGGVQAFEFTLEISNNQFWFCPNRICEIVNMPHQQSKLVVRTEGKYSISDFTQNIN